MKLSSLTISVLSLQTVLAPAMMQPPKKREAAQLKRSYSQAFEDTQEKLVTSYLGFSGPTHVVCPLHPSQGIPVQMAEEKLEEKRKQLTTFVSVLENSRMLFSDSITLYTKFLLSAGSDDSLRLRIDRSIVKWEKKCEIIFAEKNKYLEDLEALGLTGGVPAKKELSCLEDPLIDYNDRLTKGLAKLCRYRFISNIQHQVLLSRQSATIKNRPLETFTKWAEQKVASDKKELSPPICYDSEVSL